MVTAALKRPYAPYSRVAPVMETIHRLRTKGLPNPTTSSTLKLMGIAEGLAYQTIKALEFLGLLDSEGNHTEAMERLRVAPDEEYQQVLAEIIRNAYRPVFAHVDPATDDISRVTNAFKQYEPQGQWDRMVYLFAGLCREAGIMPDDGSQSTKPQTRRVLQTRKPQRSVPRTKPIMEDANPEPQMPISPPVSNPSITDILTVPWREVPSMNHNYNLIAGLVDQLPRDGRWTQERRDRWVRAVEAAVDLLVEVVPAES